MSWFVMLKDSERIKRFRENLHKLVFFAYMYLQYLYGQMYLHIVGK